MRRLPALALLLALALPDHGRAASMSMGHEYLAPGTSLAQCLSRAQQAFLSVGLRLITTTQDAAWAENAAADQLYSIYCIADRGVAMVIGAAENTEDADPVVSRLRQAFTRGGK